MYARPKEATHRPRRRRGRPRLATHVILIVPTGLVFWTGLFVGLQLNSNAGTALVLVAALMFVANVAWMFLSRR